MKTVAASKLSARVDRFLRWFFTASPDAVVEPPPRREAAAAAPSRAASRPRASSPTFAAPCAWPSRQSNERATRAVPAQGLHRHLRRSRRSCCWRASIRSSAARSSAPRKQRLAAAGKATLRHGVRAPLPRAAAARATRCSPASATDLSSGPWPRLPRRHPDNRRGPRPRQRVGARPLPGAKLNGSGRRLPRRLRANAGWRTAGSRCPKPSQARCTRCDAVLARAHRLSIQGILRADARCRSGLPDRHQRAADVAQPARRRRDGDLAARRSRSPGRTTSSSSRSWPAITALLAPALFIGLRLYVLVPLAAGNKPPGFAWCVRVLHQAGALEHGRGVHGRRPAVAGPPLRAWPTRSPGPGLFALGAVTVLFAAIESAGLKHLWWHVR